MIRYILFTILGLLITMDNYGQFSDHSYVQVTTPREKVTDPSTLTNSNSDIAIQYYDGLGRPIQKVQRGITSTGADLIDYTEYDAMGHKQKQWLPSYKNGNNGAFINLETFKTVASSSYENDSRPFTEFMFEASPLNRMLGQQEAGSSWEGHIKTIAYGANISNEVALYSITEDHKLTRSKFYDASVLYKTKTIDEDGKVRFVFKDKQEQIVLKREINEDETIDTYFVYDDFGKLCYVLPPLAADVLTNGTYEDDNSFLKQYAYMYKYDKWGNCTYKRLPGCEPIYMLYDKADRLVLSQDGNQRTRSQWTVTKYDVLGRVLYTGLINREIAPSEKELIKTITLTETYDGSSSFYNTGYTCSYFTSEISPLVINYYDNYNFLPQGSSLSYNSSMEQDGYTPKYTPSSGGGGATGLLTGTQVYLLDGSGTSTTTVMYYDDKGHVVQNRATNHLGGTDLVYNQYDFTGKAIKTLKEHTGKALITELYRNDYDIAGRLLKTYYTLNNNEEVLLVDNSAPDAYDELGRLRKKKRHYGTDTEEFDYNIRNWATRIKSGTLEEKLYYNTNPAGATPCFNGNISYSTFQKETQNILGYAYSYDGLNRLEKANSTIDHVKYTDIPFYSEYFTYDKMGNIKYLTRYDDEDAMDQLELHYNGNQVINVDDIMGSRNEYHLKEYQDKAQNGIDSDIIEMSYDPNGNLVKDLDRDIATIQYNVLNLPEIIQFKNGNQIKNLYDASGIKLRSDYYTRLTNITPIADGDILSVVFNLTDYSYSGTSYIGNIEYKISKIRGPIRFGKPMTYVDNIIFSRIYNQEGYVENLSSLNYFYYRKDHLGNNREVWCANTNQVVQQTQYYPSGLPWLENASSSVQDKKYNGKEFVEMHGYDTYDYGARGMYAAIGRFTSVDPLAEKYYNISPYAYCAGNPINNIDPFGMDVWTTTDPATIREAYNALLNGDDVTYNEKKWSHKTDKQFLSHDEGESYSVGLNYSDKTGHFFLGTAIYGGIAIKDLGKAKLNSDPNSQWDIYGFYSLYTENETKTALNTCLSVAGGELLGGALEGMQLFSWLGRASKAGEAGEYAVYHSVSNGVTEYVGITNNLARRAAEHLASKGISIKPLLQGLSKYDARAVEQALIEINGLSKNGGTLINKINSIAKTNPIYSGSLKRGYELLKSIGYK